MTEKPEREWQREITQPVKLLTHDGRVQCPGYAKKMHYLYNKENIHAGTLAVKEWDFYQISCGGGWILQMTVGHVSYMANFSAALFHIVTGERREITRMSPLPLKGIPMPKNPEHPHVIGAKGKDYRILFQTGRKVRLLTLKAQDMVWGDIDMEIRLQNDMDNDKMVIATPFDEPGQFYLNYKENYYRAAGRVKFGGLAITLERDAVALLDWGRGVWPFRQEWYWGNGTGRVDGKPFGFNIGWGFGDLRYATENFFFYERKGYKLGTLAVQKDEEDWKKPWRFTSSDGCFDLSMEPVYDNHTRTKLAFVDNECHQVFGRFHGKVCLPCGKELQVEELLAFCEHARNRW